MRKRARIDECELEIVHVAPSDNIVIIYYQKAYETYSVLKVWEYLIWVSYWRGIAALLLKLGLQTLFFYLEVL